MQFRKVLLRTSSWFTSSKPAAVVGRRVALIVIGVPGCFTERRKIEAQLLRAQRMESIGTLAGGIAHDLNNVLAPIPMGMDLLRDSEHRPLPAA